MKLTTDEIDGDFNKSWLVDVCLIWFKCEYVRTGYLHFIFGKDNVSMKFIAVLSYLKEKYCHLCNKFS